MNKQIRPADVATPVGAILAQAGVLEAYFFGSFARGDDDRFSDIDILLVDTGVATSEQLRNAISEIEALLLRKVDLVDSKSLPAHVLATALAECVPLLSSS
jgi:uncharacterized protein